MVGRIFGIGHDDQMSSSPVRPPRLTPSDYLGRIDRATEQFADLIATGDLTAALPTCPGWTFTDLIAHLGEIHQWAAHAIVAGNPDAETIPEPSEPAALVDWYRMAAGVLTDVLRTTDPEAPAWTFGPKPRTASFWFRRQIHETTVHLWDAGRAQNQSRPIDDVVARDGIDEVTGLFFPRQVRLGRIPPLERTLALVADSDRWVLAGDGTDPDPGVEAEATVHGPPEPLLLLLWGRIGLDDPRLQLSGDEAVADAVLRTALVP